MKVREIKTKNGNELEKKGGRYCNLESKECKKYNKVYSDDGGYICANCGGRVSKWLPISQIILKRK